MTRRELPAKLYFRIGEAAQVVGVEPHVLRYWESEFQGVRPQKSSKGQRVYSRKDVELLLKVRDLLHTQKFTIAGARKKLREGGYEPSEPVPERVGLDPAVRERLRTALTTARAELCKLLDELGPD